MSGTNPNRKRRENKRVIVLMESDSSSQSSRREFSVMRLRAYAMVGGVALAGLLLLVAFLSSGWLMNIRNRSLIEENRLLSEKLAVMQQRVGTLAQRVDSLGREEDAIRVKVNLPAISDEVRAAGTGSLAPLEEKMIGDERIEDMIKTLDHLERQLSIQMQSFGEIEDKIKNDEDRLRYIPSIIPVKGARFTDGYGYRRDPFTGYRRFHYGADFSAPTGTEVYVAADGVVKRVRRRSGYGKTIEVDHGYGYLTVYGHLHDYNVRRGQRVNRGDVIGYVGNTGRSTAPHLHYEVQVEGRPVDPLDFFYEGYRLAER
ncbi:peptidoglycan DD-metalloendopeptidase family protein [bacterium]|nr:peptidoglycan DD-metalloendopeptidase family protein [bacterium]